MKKLLAIAVSIALLATAIFFLLRWVDPPPASPDGTASIVFVQHA